MKKSLQNAFAGTLTLELERLDAVLECSPVPTFVIDLEHRVTHWNRACEVVLRYSAEQMIGKADQWKPFYKQARPVMADLVVSGELGNGLDTYYANKYRRSLIVPDSFEAEDYFPEMGPEGTWLYFTAAPLRNALGELVGAIETLQDVSAQHRTREALRREHEILNAIIDHFPCGISLIDDNLNVVKHNEEFRRILDFPKSMFSQEEISLENVLRFNAERGEYGSVDVDEYINKAMRQARDLQPHAFERTRPNGTVLEIKGAPVPGGGFVTSYADITERKRTEAQIARLLEEQKIMFDNAHVGIVWVKNRVILNCNHRLAEMFQFSGPDALEGVLTRVFYKSHEQWDYIGTQMYADLEKKGFAQGEFEMRRQDGSPIWVMLTGRPIDQKNVNVGSVWVYIDVTEKHEQEVQLQLAERVFAHSSEALLITDARGLIVNVNRAFTEITGYSASEVIGQNPRILKSGRHDAAFYDAMWSILESKGQWEGEVWDRRKNGDIYPKWLSITIVRDDQGQVINYIGSFSDISDRKAAEEKINFLAYHDPLTSLPNRLMLRERFAYMLSQIKRSGRSMAFMFLDLDHFKRINDSLGHRVGDSLLIQVVKRIKSCLRESDTVSRQGGDEFIVLLGDMSSHDAVAGIAGKLIAAIAQPFDIAGHSLNTSASIGIAMVPSDGEDFDILMQKADTAMYASKEAARGTFSFFHQSMNDLANRRLDLANSLRRALSNQEFNLVYQPQVYADSGVVFGAEALLRWNNSLGQAVSPAEFIPVAEETGLILPLGEWVISQACDQARRWRDEGLNCRLAVNVSGIQIYRSDLLDTISRCTRESGIPPELIQVELTESTLVEDSILVSDVISGLKGIGVSVAIDDFGTGYSSLAYLKRFSVDKLKIDRSFIVDACTNEESAAMARAVISIASSLRMRSIAEGVENACQLDFVRQSGCNEIQGYFYSKPLSASDYKKFAISRK